MRIHGKEKGNETINKMHNTNIASRERRRHNKMRYKDKNIAVAIPEYINDEFIMFEKVNKSTKDDID